MQLWAAWGVAGGAVWGAEACQGAWVGVDRPEASVAGTNNSK